MTNPASPPLSSFRRSGDLVLTAGQVGIDPATGTAPDGFEAQMRQALDNLRAVLADAGSSLDRVLKTTVFVVRREDVGEMNRIYREAFGEPYPSRSTIVCDLVDERLLFEIEAIAEV